MTHAASAGSPSRNTGHERDIDALSVFFLKDDTTILGGWLTAWSGNKPEIRYKIDGSGT